MTFRTPTGLALLLRAVLCTAIALGAPQAMLPDSRAGDLDQVRGEVRDDDERDAKVKKRRRSRDDECDHDDCCDDPNVFEELIGNTLLFTVTAPWWGPRLAVGDDGLWAGFPPAPYALGHPGYLVIDPIDPAGTDGWALRLSSEYGTDFDDLDRIGARLIVDTSSRFGFDTEWNQWIESTPAGTDDLATGDFNFVYRFAQHERVQYHTGVGMNWLADDAGSEFGVNFTWGVQAFPRDPFVLDAVLDVGSLGDAFLLHFRTTAGVVWGPAEIFAGYDRIHIGDATLQGVLAGVRFWF
jgi:hypothetical protein